MYTQKSFVLKPADADKKWFVIDAKGKVLGRLATQVTDILRGKVKPDYTPNTDSGDFVVVINADKVVLTGKKLTDKKYYRHTNHIGGLKMRTAGEQLTIHPELLLETAVKGMLPPSSLGRKQLTKLKIYTTETHPHGAQNPQVLN